jgi:membrane protease YdiL (CAAX protease family)
MDRAEPNPTLGIILRVGIFAFLAVPGLYIFSLVFNFIGGRLIAGALGTFAAAAVANAIALRIYENARLADIGLGWNRASGRNLLLGVAGGVGAAGLVIGGPLLVGAARIQDLPETFNFGSVLFVSVVLLFGAVGEEMLFRGYGFQLLLGKLGPYATILPVSVLFALAHSGNLNVTVLGLVNTMAWGVLLGWAFLRSGDLWLPIGLHYGWNCVLPLFGVNLSGFTMGMTGYAVEWKVGDLWSGGAYGPEAGLLTGVVLIVLVYYLHRAPIERQSAYLLRSLEEA